MSSQFWNMGGYALYVWGSFGMAAAVFVWNLAAPRMQHKEILKKLAGQE